MFSSDSIFSFQVSIKSFFYSFYLKLEQWGFEQQQKNMKNMAWAEKLIPSFTPSYIWYTYIKREPMPLTLEQLARQERKEKSASLLVSSEVGQYYTGGLTKLATAKSSFSNRYKPFEPSASAGLTSYEDTPLLNFKSAEFDEFMHGLIKTTKFASIFAIASGINIYIEDSLIPIPNRSAGDILADKSGTDVARAVLLCACLRYAGIPARLSEGYVQKESGWVHHAWVDVNYRRGWRLLDISLTPEETLKTFGGDPASISFYDYRTIADTADLQDVYIHAEDEPAP